VPKKPNLDRVVAVSGRVPEEHLLGRLATYSLPDDPQNGAKVVETFARHGLDVNYLPEARQPVHIFQSACASVRSRRPADSNRARMEIASDEIDNNGTCSYQITVRVWDRANKVIEHEKGMRVTFDKDTSEITTKLLNKRGQHAWDKDMQAIERAIRKDFTRNAKTVPGQKIRNGIRAMLLDIGAQNVRRKAGGLYFVPTEWPDRSGNPKPTLPVLDGLKGALADLYGEDADFWKMALMGEDEEREMVRKHFALNANLQIEELTAKVVNRVRAGKGDRGVRQELLSNVFNERRAIAGAIKQFQDLVNVELSEFTGALDVLDQAMNDLNDLAAAA
jgi:hypothetical protein